MSNQINKYYCNNGKRIKQIVNKILKHFGGISQKDYDDFYSVANETFAKALKNYDETQNFDAFIYTCIKRKIMTEVTRRNRQKRKSDVNTISLDANKYDEDNKKTRDIASNFDVWEEVLKHQCKDSKIESYLHKLSKRQQCVLFLMADSYKSREIEAILHITHEQFMDCLEEIRSYKNVSILLD